MQYVNTSKGIQCKRSLRALTLAGASIFALGFSGAALAQSEDEGASEEAIIVTGSRLKQSNLVAISPITQVSAEEIKIRGTVRIEDMLNILPQAFAGQTSEVSNGASGTSTLNLRGLGSIRTLVMIDGKRLPFGSPNSSPANLDLIPAALVERVDVVTGGQSAVYGSDAIGGVANFILRRNFEGIEVDAQVGYNQDSNNNKFAQSVLAGANQPIPGGSTFDGRNVSLSVTMGANAPDDRGNVTVNLSYQNQNAIEQGTRDISGCAFGGTNAPGSVDGIGCVGSTASATGRFLSLDNGNQFFLQPDGQIVPFTGIPSQTFNFNPFNFFQRPNERFSMTTLARYDVTNNVEAYLDLSFTNNKTDAQIAPTGTFFANGAVNCSNPFLGSGPGSFFDVLSCTNAPGAVSNVLINRRNVEGGGRNSNIELTTWRMVGGLRGDLGDNFSYDVFGQFSRTNLTSISSKDFSIANLTDALNVVNGPNGPVCASGNAGCVPYNVFQIGGVTQGAINYIQQDAFVNGFTEQKVLGGNIQGDLTDYGLKSPFADSGIQTLVGYEFRKDELSRSPDAISATPGGGLTGVGGATLPVAGVTRLFELYAETQIPLVTDAPLAQELSFNGAYRYSDYTVNGNGVKNGFTTDTYAAGLSWVPIDDIRVRGQYQRAVRAPNIIELFSSQNTGLFNLTSNPDGSFDDCAGATPFRSLAECQRTGVTAATYGTIPDNSAGQFNAITGGNPLLEPEVSDTYTLGVILTPSMIPGLSVSVDYFDIKVNKTIATIPPNQAFENCLNTGDPAFCNLIQRDVANSLFVSSSTGGITATNVNIASLSTSGVDIAATYSMDLGNQGSMSIDYVSTILDSSAFESFPGSGKVECKGVYGTVCGVPTPTYRHRLMGTWQSPYDVNFSTTWRYFGSVDLEGTPNGTIDDHFSSKSYVDLSASWFMKENVVLRAGVNNLFDVDPPLSTSLPTGTGNGNTFPGVYDSVGRQLFVGINVAL